MTIEPSLPRILALALTMLVLLAGGAGAFLLVRSWAMHHQHVAVLAAERAKYLDLLRDAPAMKNEVEKLRASPTEKSAFVPSASGPETQATVSAIVTQSGGAMRHVSVELKTEGDEAPVELRADVRFSSGTAQLARILYDFRRARPYLFVTKLAVRSSAAGRLDVELAAISYVRAP